jgi:hypothetical protein
MGYLRSVAGPDTTGRKLDFSVKLYLDRSVPVDDDEASRSAIGLSTQNGALAFVTALGVCPACHAEALRRWEPSRRHRAVSISV